jgi:competence protein ComEC
VLDVGQGLASVVQTHDHLLVYDPGPLYGPESDAGQRVVVPYLRVLGANRVDMMILSHRDSDHAGGAASVVSALPVEEVRSSYGEPGSLPCRAGLRWQWDGVDFEILHPGQNPVPQGDFLRGAVDGKNSNNFSCVLRVVVSGHAMLLTADLEASDEAVLLAQTPAKLAADVLQVAHHGSRSSSSAEFLVAVGAKEAVIPVGYRNRFGHPVEEVLARLEALDSRLWRTDRDGALRIDLAAEGVRVAAWREEHRRYWHGR